MSTTSATIASMHTTAIVDVAFSVSIVRNRLGGAVTTSEASTTAKRGTPNVAVKQSAATIRYETAVPVQLTTTATSTTRPEPGSAASHTV